MKTIVALLSFIGTVGTLTGQLRPPQRQFPPGNQPAADATPSAKPGRVEGVVTNSVNGEAVKKATVTLQGQFSYATSSDISGHFVFATVEPGSYQIFADRSGYLPQQNMGRSPMSVKPVKVDEDKTVKDVEVKLLPLGTVAGHVLDEDGDPLIRAQVRALRYNYNQGKRQLMVQGFASTNDLGEYQFIDLQPGRYYFMASDTPRRMSLPAHTRTEIVEQTYPATYYPNGLDVGQAAASEVAAGGHVTNIDFRLNKVRSFHIRGKVIDGQTGQVAKNIGLQIMPRGGPMNGFQSFAQVEQDGTFDATGIAAGSYVIVSQANRGIGVSAHQQVNVADQDATVLVTLVPGLEISGKVVFDGTPPQQMNVNVSLQGSERGSANARVEATDGSFLLHNVTPDVYQVAVFALIPGKYVKSIHFGDQEVPSGEIDLTQQTSGTITVYFGGDGGQITGTVQDRNGQPAVSTIITVAPAEGLDDRHDLFKTGHTDNNGGFTIQDVAPGTYKVFAWESADMNMVQVPEFRKPFESQAASVSLGASGHESVQLKVITAEDVEAGKSKMQ